MKKLLTLALLALAISAQAQQQAGDLSIQFSGNYYSQRYEFGSTTFKTFAGNLYVKVGKFFTPNIELGLKPNLIFSPKIETDANDPGNIKTKLKVNTGFGIYGTYSFLTADAKMMPYGGAEINYSPLSDESSVNLGPYAGVKYFLTEKINIDANVNYLINLGSSFPTEDDYKISPLFQLNIGIGVIIGKVE